MTAGGCSVCGEYVLLSDGYDLFGPEGSFHFCGKSHMVRFVQQRFMLGAEQRTSR